MGPVPANHTVKGISTYFGKDGSPQAQWVKTVRSDADRFEEFKKALLSIAEPFDPLPPRASSTVYEDWLAVYPMGDPHIGMLSWFEETGENFDLRIAEASLVAAVDRLVDLAIPAKTALIINLGDFFHADNVRGQTTAGTQLDTDSRWAKMTQVGIRTMRRCIERALEKHETVRVMNVVGNHDTHTSAMLTAALSCLYENEPRVAIDKSPNPFLWYRFGRNLIGATHGDTCKVDQLPQIMAVDRKVDWGETEHRRFYTGHIHHDTLKELHGCIVESFRTLAARDAWHHAKGYRSGRDMKVDLVHRQHGWRTRHTVGFGELCL